MPGVLTHATPEDSVRNVLLWFRYPLSGCPSAEPDSVSRNGWSVTYNRRKSNKKSEENDENIKIWNNNPMRWNEDRQFIWTWCHHARTIVPGMNESRSHSTTFLQNLYVLSVQQEFQGVLDGSYCCENDHEADSTVAPLEGWAACFRRQVYMWQYLSTWFCETIWVVTQLDKKIVEPCNGKTVRSG